MKSSSKTHAVYAGSLALMLFALFVVNIAVAQANPGIALPVKNGSKLVLNGTSTLHDFTCTTSDIEGTIMVDPTQLTGSINDAKNLIMQASINIPVKSIKSGHDGMDNNMYDALKADKDPTITYQLTGITAAAPSGTEYQIQTTGMLSVAGVQKQVEMNVYASKTDNGLKIHGKEDINMTDFGIDPPSFMFGALKAGNKVTVSFDLILSK
ncbi:MAG TPA: YceI family protein [Candidatus Kapabacteria bacterium]|nr:YceI family protein [Candidatus Kapabacteria bacterium]